MTKRSRSRRPVDGAMLEDRLQKQAIRDLWIAVARRHDGVVPDLRETLYFTLPGAAGTEIELLAAEGLIKRTETGAIAAEYAHRVVGLENDVQVFTQLQGKYPGLKLIRNTIENFLHGHTLTRFPQGEAESLMRARVVNLDLNEPWLAKNSEDDQWFIPMDRVVKKFGELHARNPKVAWTLLLTLHGECPWNGQDALMQQAFLESIEKVKGQGAARVAAWLGQQLYDQITIAGFAGFSGLSRENQQLVLMWLVPAMIADSCVAQGWDIHVGQCLRYGDLPHAPMVTWIIDFKVPAPRLSHAAAHAACLESLLAVGGAINATGEIVPDH